MNTYVPEEQLSVPAQLHEALVHARDFLNFAKAAEAKLGTATSTIADLQAALRRAENRSNSRLKTSKSTIAALQASLSKAEYAASQPELSLFCTATRNASTKAPIQDTGATDTFYRQSDSKYLSEISPGGGLVVGLPNGDAIRSVATGKLHTIPISTTVHIFPDNQLDRSLNSTADFCNQGCTATFTATSMTIVHDESRIIVASSTKLPTDKLWPSYQHDSNLTPIPPIALANIMVRHEINADFVAYVHACLGSPSDSTMLRALKAGYLSEYGRITANMFSSNMPNSIATAKGHLDQTRQGSQSTTKQRKSPTKPISVDINDESDFGPEQFEKVATFQVIKANENASDLTGKFPYISRRGFMYQLISIYRSYIHVELMKDKSAAEYLRAMRLTYLFFSSKGHKPEFQGLDNETSSVIEAFLKEEAKVTFQYVPANTHRRNRAERAIRSWKNHFIATLATTDPEMPKNLWDELVVQAELTLSHLRAYSMDKSISSYEGIYGSKFDFSAHPLNVLGVRTVALNPADKRESWAPHGSDCFYLGAALHHYRCHRVYVPATNDIRITDSLSWHQTKTLAPGASKEELIYDRQLELMNKLDALQISIAHNPTYANDPSLQQLIADARTSLPAPNQRVADTAPSQRVVSDIPHPHPTESTALERKSIKATEQAQQKDNPTGHF